MRHSQDNARLTFILALSLPLLLALGVVATLAQDTPPDEGEFRDAPEGALAYPVTGVVGMFPTCKGVGPAGHVHHAAFPFQFLGPLKSLYR